MQSNGDEASSLMESHLAGRVGTALHTTCKRVLSPQRATAPVLVPSAE